MASLLDLYKGAGRGYMDWLGKGGLYGSAWRGLNAPLYGAAPENIIGTPGGMPDTDLLEEEEDIEGPKLDFTETGTTDATSGTGEGLSAKNYQQPSDKGFKMNYEDAPFATQLGGMAGKWLGEKEGQLMPGGLGYGEGQWAPGKFLGKGLKGLAGVAGGLLGGAKSALGAFSDARGQAKDAALLGGETVASPEDLALMDRYGNQGGETVGDAAPIDYSGETLDPYLGQQDDDVTANLTDIYGNQSSADLSDFNDYEEATRDRIRRSNEAYDLELSQGESLYDPNDFGDYSVEGDEAEGPLSPVLSTAMQNQQGTGIGDAERELMKQQMMIDPTREPSGLGNQARVNYDFDQRMVPKLLETEEPWMRDYTSQRFQGGPEGIRKKMMIDPYFAAGMQKFYPGFK